MRSSILFLCLALAFHIVQAGDSYSFQWMDKDQPVGELKVDVDYGENGITYHYVNVMNLNIGVEMNIRDEWTVEYRNDTLDRIAIRNNFNGRNRISVDESSVEGGALRKVNGVEKKIERDPVTASYVTLFAESPGNITMIYSELYGLDFAVERIGDTGYRVTDSKGRKHKFFYNGNGKLTKAIVEMSAGFYSLVPSGTE